MTAVARSTFGALCGQQRIGCAHCARRVGLPLFTRDACQHGGMTELEEAALTEGQGRAFSGHATKRGLSSLCQGNRAACARGHQEAPRSSADNGVDEGSESGAEGGALIW